LPRAFSISRLIAASRTEGMPAARYRWLEIAFEPKLDAILSGPSTPTVSLDPTAEVPFVLLLKYFFTLIQELRPSVTSSSNPSQY
jgi:hypothetical protein